MCGEGFFFRLFIFLRFDKFLVTHVPKNPSREGLAQLHSDPKITLDSQKLQKTMLSNVHGKAEIHHFCM